MEVHDRKATDIYDFDISETKTDSRNVITTNDQGHPIPMVCRHCDMPECVFTCISGAMTKDEETGLVKHDMSQCASCFMCVMSCPYGVLKPDKKSNKVVVKCDMCIGKGEPACVASCPTGALYVKEVDNI